MAKLGRLACPECGAGMVPTMRGLRCPRMASCGRGGSEETAATLRARRAGNAPDREPAQA